MRTTYLILFLLVFGCSSASYAGFITSRHSVTLPLAAKQADVPVTDSFRRIRSRAETFSEGYQTRQRTRAERGRSGERGGWLGITAAVCACIGEWPLAIIFGAIGMSKKYKNHRMARGAFIVGIVEAIVEVLIVFALVVALSSMGGMTVI